MIVVKFLHSILFIGFTCILYLKYNYKLEVKYWYIISLLICGIILFAIDGMLESGVPVKLFLLLLLFSFAQVLIHLMKDSINIHNPNNVLNENILFRERYVEFKSFVFDKLIIILILIYQLLLIWFPVIFNKMLEDMANG